MDDSIPDMLIFQDKDCRADGSPRGGCVVAKAGGNWTGHPYREDGFVNRSLIDDRPLILLGNGPDARRFHLIGSLPGQTFGDLFKVPPEVSVQRLLGFDRGHFSYLRFSGIMEVERGAQVLCRYLQRFSWFHSPNLSPERFDECVPGESPLVHEHTGPGAFRHTPCVDRVVLQLYSVMAIRSEATHFCGMGAMNPLSWSVINPCLAFLHHPSHIVNDHLDVA